MRGRRAPERPYLLAVDTATFTLSVAVCAADMLLAEANLRVRRGHSGDLLRVIDDLLTRARLTPRDLDALVVSLGPGSFTGLRVGLAMMKGLALGFARPLYGASSLEAIARGLAFGAPAGAWLCPCIDARKGEVYVALCRSAPQTPRGFEVVVDERVCPPEALAEVVAPAGDAEVCLAGTGATLYRTRLTELLGGRARFAPALLGDPRALHLAALARPLLAAPPPPLATLEPRYIRPSDAEIHFRRED